MKHENPIQSLKNDGEYEKKKYRQLLSICEEYIQFYLKELLLILLNLKKIELLNLFIS